MIMQKYKRGQKAYIIKNNVAVVAVTIKSYRGGFYIVQISGSPGAIRLRESRLFASAEEARAAIPPRAKSLPWYLR